MNLRDRMLARLRPTPENRSWYEIAAAVDDDDRAVVRIYDEISYWGVSADQFARDLAQVSASTIEVQINSPGGDVFDGLAIFNALRTHEARVVTRVDGLAASAASVIAQAGDERVIVDGAQMMIHEAWGVAVGPASEMREFADLLDRQNQNIAAIYATASGGDVDEFLELMAVETWMSAAETVERGLADSVLVPERKAAAKAPARPVAVTQDPAGDPPADDEIDTFDGSALLANSKVREMFGSTALAD